MSEWKTIKTAPKDGSTIRLWDGYTQGDGYWPNNRMTVEDLYMGDYWKWFGTDFTARPTHWMPLPKPPVNQTDATEE